MKITPNQVQRVADLARLELTPDEAATLAAELSTLVDHFDALNELHTGAVEPTSHAVPLSCPRRPDALQPSLDREKLLSRAPRRDDGFFVVPKVID